MMEQALRPRPAKGQVVGAATETPSQEAEWIRASQRGDSTAFNRLVLKWEKPIYNLTLRMLQDPEEASEATQEVFFSAYRGIGRFRRDARFSTWLYRIAANHCISRLRRRPPGVHYSIDEEREAYSGTVSLSQGGDQKEILEMEHRLQVRKALEYLNPDQKAVVELKFFQDLTFEEIASITQTPVSTVKSRLYSGLEILRVHLGGHDTR